MKCSFRGCRRKAECKGLCDAHRAQQRRGRPLSPIKAHRSDTHCRNGHEWVLSNVLIVKHGFAICKECKAESNRASKARIRAAKQLVILPVES